MLLAVQVMLLELRIIRHRNAVIDAIYLEVVEHQRRPMVVVPSQRM